MKILIIRHGEPDYSIDSLTPKGWDEARLLSDRLVKMEIDDFYCSPLGRAKDTAKATLGKYGKEAKILPWLREFPAQVTLPWQDKSRIPWDFPPSYWAKSPAFYEYESWLEHPLMQGGGMRETFCEITSGIDALLNGYGYQRDGYLYRCETDKEVTIALFCHFALGMTIVAYLSHISPIILWHSFFMPASSVTTLVSERDRTGSTLFRCMQVGDTSHLYAAGEPISPAGLYPDFDRTLQ